MDPDMTTASEASTVPPGDGSPSQLADGAKSAGPRPTASWTVGAAALGALALGALAIGAVVIGRAAIGRLAIGRARVGKLVIDELVIRRLSAPDQSHGGGGP
jgi:hypothetical protein